VLWKDAILVAPRSRNKNAEQKKYSCGGASKKTLIPPMPLGARVCAGLAGKIFLEEAKNIFRF
jgi:hypothetical protein